MDYEKKYKEALERAKYVVVVPQNEEALQALKETIFPELAESEDERIRKRLIDFFKDFGKTKSHCWNVSVRKILAWLEKQSKASKIEEAMRDVEQKAKAFTEANKGLTSDEILAQMKGVWTNGIMVPRWVLENVEDTLRIQHNIYLEGNRKETCQVRNVKRDLNCVRKLLGGIELTGSERTEKLIDHKVILTNKPK